MRLLTTIMLILSTLYAGAQGIEYKSIPNSDGVIRCHSMEVDSIRRANDPTLPTFLDQEQWLQSKVEEYKSGNLSNLRAGGVITIPTIFHIITDSVGADNVPPYLIQAQLDQLNIDFRNLAGSTDPVAADTEIEFCLALLDTFDDILPEPGINRVLAFGDGAFTTNFVENTIKPATIWSPTEYLNVWVADLSGGILGYAQFPDSSGLGGFSDDEGPASTDGVVVLYSSVGSVADPHPSGGPYNLGRTLTHEVGHWIGLRHIWGDGGCSFDDFCADTPESDASNYGCPETHVSCTTVDQVQNYMDYTDDDCMNIFTQDQSSRITTVMNVSPRRKELCFSMKCSLDPVIAFAQAVGSPVIEGTDCSYQDVIIEYAKNGWRFIQIFAPATKGYGTSEYFELIFEKEV